MPNSQRQREIQLGPGVGSPAPGTTQLGPKVRTGALGMGQGAKAKEAGLAAQLPSLVIPLYPGIPVSALVWGLLKAKGRARRLALKP